MRCLKFHFKGLAILSLTHGLKSGALLKSYVGFKVPTTNSIVRDISYNATKYSKLNVCPVLCASA